MTGGDEEMSMEKELGKNRTVLNNREKKLSIFERNPEGRKEEPSRLDTM